MAEGRRALYDLYVQLVGADAALPIDQWTRPKRSASIDDEKAKVDTLFKRMRDVNAERLEAHQRAIDAIVPRPPMDDMPTDAVVAALADRMVAKCRKGGRNRTTVRFTVFSNGKLALRAKTFANLEWWQRMCQWSDAVDKAMDGINGDVGLLADAVRLRHTYTSLVGRAIYDAWMASPHMAHGRFTTTLSPSSYLSFQIDWDLK
jgi:hypothetical protein